MKVLHLLNTNKFSGAENVVCTIIKNFNSNFEMFYCSPDGPIRDKLQDENIKYISIEKLSYSEVKRVIKQIKPDIIHAHDNRATIIASFFSKKCTIISHIHGNNRIRNSLNFKSLLFKIRSRKINKFIWVSDSSLDGYKFKNDVVDKSIVLYNVIDYGKILKMSKMYNCTENYDLIFLGRLGYPKNPERLIKIIEQVKQKMKNVKVAIVGDGVDKENVKELIEKLKLSKNIRLYGFQSNPYPILLSSKMLIMTSLYEGTPMCALEAQAFGKPIISTPVDGLKKIIKNDYNGFLSNSDEILVSKIIEILSDDKKYEDFSENSLKMFNLLLNLDKYINTIERIYENGD